ncbi:MAG: hypothetical protein ACI8UZ_000577 [Akkermansiaceae bacterium]|jgi:hypothetical protein
MRGSEQGPGALLSTLPLDRQNAEVLIGGDSADFANSVSTSFDLEGDLLAIDPTSVIAFEIDHSRGGIRKDFPTRHSHAEQAFRIVESHPMGLRDRVASEPSADAIDSGN